MSGFFLGGGGGGGEGFFFVVVGVVLVFSETLPPCTLFCISKQINEIQNHY